MRPRRTEGHGSLDKVLNQPVATLYLVSFLSNVNKKTDYVVIQQILQIYI